MAEDNGVQPPIVLRQSGSSIDPEELKTWRTYSLHTEDPVLSPASTVRLESISRDTHLLSVGGWMGRLRVVSGSSSRSLLIREPKLDDSAWNRLLDDLADAVVALPLAELVEGTDVARTREAPTPFVRRLVLRAFAERITHAFDSILRRPHETLESSAVWTTPDRATIASPGAIVAAFQRGSIATRGPAAERLGRPLPTTWRDERKETTTDTPENRFVVHATELILRIAGGFPEDDLLTRLAVRARHVLTQAPLRDAGPFRRFPAASRVLRERFGYRELRDAYLALQGSARVRWEGLDSAIRGGLRNTEVLYQYWCFLALQRQLGVEQPTLPTRRTASTLHIELAEGKPSGVETPRGFLWHERQFSPPNGTYSVPFRPDFSLARADGSWDLFDAKFRLDSRSEAKHDDLAKMHAYRDAIRGCHAAWVLYPGTEHEIHPAMPDQPADDPSGIGVIPLRP